MTEKSSGGCFRVGCLGCAGVGALVVGGILVVSLLQRGVEGRGETVDQDLSQPLPVLPPSTLESLAALDAQAEQARPHFLGDLEQTIDLGDPPVGRIELDFSMGELYIGAGPEGEPIRVTAAYNDRAYRLREELEPSADGGWTYRLSFRGRGVPRLLTTTGDGDPHVELTIPRGHPVDIVGKIGIGKTEADLGGLWLRNVDLRLGTGEHELAFSEPLLLPMETFRLRKGMGSLEVKDLGRASPREVRVRQSIGESRIDLSGPWRRDASVFVKLGIGELRLRLPEEVHLDVDEARVRLGERRIDLPDAEGIPENAPRLSLNLQGNIGEVRAD